MNVFDKEKPVGYRPSAETYFLSLVDSSLGNGQFRSGVNNNMAQTARRTSYRVMPEMPAPHYSTPESNYLSGDGKSYIWAGSAYYTPSQRVWIKYPDYRSLPRETRRDAIDFQSEDQWVDFMRNRDQPSGMYYSRVGLRGSGFPPLKLNGYTRSLPTMPSRDIFESPWPRSDAWVPPVRRDHGSYYGYYHDRIERERERRKKELPTSQKIEPHHVPTVAYNYRWGFDQP